MSLPGAEERDDAMRRAEAGASEEWKAEAREAILILAGEIGEFTTDDVWELIEKPREPRALGPVMTRLANEGVIERTNVHRASNRPVCHRNPKRVWKVVS